MEGSVLGEMDVEGESTNESSKLISSLLLELLPPSIQLIRRLDTFELGFDIFLFPFSFPLLSLNSQKNEAFGPMPSQADPSGSSPCQQHLPRDARVIALILASKVRYASSPYFSLVLKLTSSILLVLDGFSQGIDDTTPQVLHQLLEFAHRSSLSSASLDPFVRG